MGVGFQVNSLISAAWSSAVWVGGFSSYLAAVVILAPFYFGGWGLGWGGSTATRLNVVFPMNFPFMWSATP